LPCLERGVNTLMEKPPGMSVAETTALRDAAARTGAKGMVGFQRRFHPMVLEARALIEERGPVTQILGEFHKSMTSTEASGKFPEVMMDNVLLETPIHSIDLVRAIAGSDVAEVHSVVRRALSSHKDVHAALVVFENGCVAQIAANYTGPERLQRYEVHGRDISAYLVGISEGWVVTHEGRVDLMDPAGSGGGIELDRFFIDCVKNDRPISAPAADLDEAVKTMDLAEAILSGLRE
jgi:predicted dehydrogenase